MASSLLRDTRVSRITKETAVAILALVGLFAHIFLRFAHSPHSSAPLIAVLVAGGPPLLAGLIRNILRGDVGSDLLAGISIAVSLILGEYLAGVIIVLMLASGTGLEQYAARRASNVLEALAKRMPRVAHRVEGALITEVSLDQIRIGDLVSVLPHQVCPVDGVIDEGHGSMNEAFLTGEPFQISKSPGACTLSGAINGETALRVLVTSLPADTRYSKITRVLREAENNRPRFRRLADRLGAWYSLLALAIAAAAWAASSDPKRFLAVLVIATPCPLLLAVPIAILGAISAAAHRSIIIKDPAILEQINLCRTVIFDKTGTLTYGEPSLSSIHTATPRTENDVLQLAASLEQYSKHPLAASLIAASRERGLTLHSAEAIHERPGEGLTGVIECSAVQIMSRAQALARGVTESSLPASEPGMECILLKDGAYSGAFFFQDAPRLDSHSFVQHLGPRHQIGRLILLSGDREAQVRYLAQKVGINEVFFGKSPEEKLAIVRQEAQRAPVLFLGDGVNDAPSMQAANAGIAFGPNCDITAEAAGAVILTASFGKVDELLHIGRRMRRIALQSAGGGMALSIVGMFFAATGHLSPAAGAIAQEVIDALAVLNALRMAAPTGSLKDF